MSRHTMDITSGGELTPSTGATFASDGDVEYQTSGQLDPFLTKAMDPVSEEQHLKDIWHELGVGQSGYLTIAELATVCEHIGMDEMNRAELQQLFDKLDVDADSRVSFQEFLQGLFQHGGPSSPATPVRPLSSTRQKLRLSAVPIMEESRLTPSLLSATPALLTPLDPDNVGYAKADAIIELWENLGIPQGAEILEYLQFDVAAKVNLIDLSYALEQELRGVEEDNAIYHAGLVSYQYQLKHLMSHGEQLTAERDKLRADLGEAHGRIALLVKEGDERHTALERSRDKDVKSVERRYQEQIKALQNELDQEREVIVHQTARQRQYLEAEIERLKDEESKLKDKLAVTQKELDRLESEVLDMAERCNEMERQNLRQQRELEATADIQHKLEELESNREVVRDEQEKFSEQKLLQLELENKDLKDRSDELTMELQELRQVASGTQRQHVRSRRLGSELAEPQLGGSVLSDYVTKTRQDSPEGHSEDDAASATSSGTSSRTRRRLPSRPSESGTSAPGDGELRDRFQLEMEVLRMESARVHEENETLQLEIHQLSVEKESWLEHQAKLEAERDGLLSEKLDLSQHRDAFLKDKTDLSEERDALLKDKIGLSEEREGLLKDKTCFSEERDALLKDKIGLSEERDILLKDKTCLSEEREGLLKDKIDLSEERDILLKDKTCLSEERDALLKNKKDLGEERESLLKAKDALEAECECLVKEKTAVTVERDGLLRERNKLRKEHDELVTDKQLLEVERRTVVKDRDQVEEETELLVRETERLQQELTSLTKEKAFLEEENDHLQGERDRLDGEAELANLKVNTIQREKDGLQANLEDLQRQLAATRDDSEVKVKVKDSHLVRFQGEMEELQREKEVLVTQHVSEVGALQRALSTDRKDLEDSFKMEIALIEDRHIQEKNDFLKKFKLEKEKQEAEQAVRLQESLEQQDEELKKTFQAEKEDLVIKAESEKNLIRHKFEEEKTALIDSLKRESSRELDEKLREQRQEHITQLEATVSRDRSDSDSLRQQRAQLEQQLRVQRDDMEAERSRERASLLEQADRERSDLLERQRRELAEYDAMLTKGTDGLRGQLKVDFYRLLDEERRLVAESERARVESECEALRERLESEVKGERVERDSQALRDRLQREHQLEVDRLKEELEREKKWMTLEMEREKKEWEKEKERLRGDAERERGSFTRRVEKERDSLIQAHGRDKTDLERQHEQNIRDSQRRHEQELDILRQEKRHLEAELRQNDSHHQDLNLERERMRDDVEHDVRREVQDKLEADFLGQVERLKVTFTEERAELESRVQLLSRELEESSRQREQEDAAAREQNQRQLRDLDGRHRREVDELTKANERAHENIRRLEGEKRDLRRDLDRLLEAVTAREREQPVNVANNRALQAAVPPSSGQSETDREKAILQAIDGQKRLLVEKTSELKDQLSTLDQTARTEAPLKVELERLTQEKHRLEGNLREKNRQAENLEGDLGEKNRRVQELEGDLGEKNKRMKELEADLQEKKRRVKELEADLQQKNRQVEEVEADLREKNKRVDALGAEARTAQQHKAKLGQWEAERDALKEQVALANQQLDDANTALALAASQHQRETQALRERADDMVAKSNFNEVCENLADAERRARDLETAMERRSAETTKLLMSAEEARECSERGLQEAQQETGRQLAQSRALLDDQVDRLNSQLKKSAKTDLLVKDLYVENANLVKSLEETERREKNAEKQVFELQDKCRAFQRLLMQIYPAVVG